MFPTLIDNYLICTTDGGPAGLSPGGPNRARKDEQKFSCNIIINNSNNGCQILLSFLNKIHKIQWKKQSFFVHLKKSFVVMYSCGNKVTYNRKINLEPGNPPCVRH